MQMNFKISTFLKFSCCLILLTSSINSLDNDEHSGEDESHSQTLKKEGVRSIEEQLNGFSVELRQFKEREHLLNVEVETIDEELHIEVDAINKILIKNETLETPAIPLIDFHKCHKSVDIKKDEPVFSWVITDMKKKMNQTEMHTGLYSEIFPLKGYSMKAQAVLMYAGLPGYLYCLLSYKDSNKTIDDVVDLKPLPTVTYVFKNQSQSGHYNDVIIKELYRPFNETFKYDTYKYYDILINSTYDVSDTVVIEFYVETPEQAKQSCSEDGTITWAVRDVSKGRELGAFHISPYFYSGPRGYRTVVGIKLNHDENWVGKMELIHVPPPFVWIVVTNGPYDQDLSSPRFNNLTLTFLHPTDPTKNVRIAMLEDEDVSYEKLENVLVNDTLYYHVTTEFKSLQKN